MRRDGTHALGGTDPGARSAPGFSRHTRTVGRALSVAKLVMSFTTEPEVPRLRTAAERERHDVVDLQPSAPFLLAFLLLERLLCCYCEHCVLLMGVFPKC